MQSHFGDVDEIDKSKIGTLTALLIIHTPFAVSRIIEIFPSPLAFSHLPLAV